jgi:hypothetical protein
MLLRGNALQEYAFWLPRALDANSSGGHVNMRVACDIGHTMCPKEHGGTGHALFVECHGQSADASGGGPDRSRV